MNIAIYSPYLDTAGGGEKYMLTIAECLSGENAVDVLLDTHLKTLPLEHIIKKIESLHGLDLSKVNFINAPLGAGSSSLARFFFLRKYDYLFFLTDGSVFWNSAKNGIIHFQRPFDPSGHAGWLDAKLKTWRGAIFNSKFTGEYIQKRWKLSGQVIYPPVTKEHTQILKKKKQIVSVGRFFGFTKSKKHEVMISAFKKLIDTQKISGWSLHLAGGAGVGDMSYVESLKKDSLGYPIFFYPNISLEKRSILYGESSIYWHAAGYGESNPADFEHFGITTVESMMSGCVPVVVNKGGQKEIVEDGVSGLLWDTEDELVEKTLSLIQDEKMLKKLASGAIKHSQLFSKEAFVRSIKKLVFLT
ncbi:hypothetical protein A2631_02955 [Candidatus Daviesbacteria bacterium RIFCSPHIGHO2_01_FULL_44_29]|uniref:Glycosyl transferase family 1 domain-containing protein n=1 Tax=Candidatus Daviesbacteria bacterium RIFCSPHIGHO2_02_FULL_43_12 TaxID=1797776 RepID=A0A1F5KK96_9BACT|nr:MAG: hypothetical protein A2631_02955 [Candidatus Daviesbacteria bacterium RIFCSPHIGHO2_01_FULL_44_29]OGE40804.1 MAG: hypothetical protein A3E86_02395 [Candidatus Daviesbacteria bacterium RIFCSPHIGHO2_12_FULL_47_45]OGE41343.1 MAG: hypothetical protein A3D25_02350 [Candidatus Daviesbacteria bacterium RIFCSPHIGHO2_02_FULL_43_12]OGE69544.1 MAG: hypothetical protein A3B55_04095 [Candidatus Daviesbacteria bacterium RIFCSPLOWO2_01_FULL_43_15]